MLCILFFIGETYSIDNYEMTNVFDILEYLLTNIINTAIQTLKPKEQWNLISSAGKPENPMKYFSYIYIYMCMYIYLYL